MPQGSVILDEKVIKSLKEYCYNNEWQYTDMCMHGVKDPENNLLHKRSTILMSTFHLPSTAVLCDGHQGKAHQWTKGQLSKRYNNMSRLGYSQSWTPRLCKLLLKDFKSSVRTEMAYAIKRCLEGTLGSEGGRMAWDSRAWRDCESSSARTYWWGSATRHRQLRYALSL